MAIILGKKTYGRLETLQYANEKFNWSDNWIIGISQSYALKAWILARLSSMKCIYYCIDFYSPTIAENALDRIWIWFAMQADKFLCRHCDRVWDISERINWGRYFQADHNCESEIVPLSYPPGYFRWDTFYYPNGCFVGKVEYGKEIWENKAEHIKHYDLNYFLSMISQYKFGVSIWKDDGNNFYGDPGKTKLYLACGIPVIMTNNTPFAHIVSETKAGIVLERYSRRDFDRAVRRINRKYSFYKNNVPKTWRYINADKLFKNIRILE